MSATSVRLPQRCLERSLVTDVFASRGVADSCSWLTTGQGFPRTSNLEFPAPRTCLLHLRSPSCARRLLRVLCVSMLGTCMDGMQYCRRQPAHIQSIERMACHPYTVGDR